MHTKIWIRPVLSVVSLLATSSTAFATTFIVDDSGGFDFTDVQPAIDAATDGDTIMVRPGTYSDFVIDDKSLNVFALTSTPNIVGTVYVSNLSMHKHVVISGFSVVARTVWPTSETALVMNMNLGSIRIQNCTFKGGAGSTLPVWSFCGDADPYGSGGIAADLFYCTNVAFNGCTFLGGDGFGAREASCFDSFGGNGGHAVQARTSQLAIYDCVATGGKGGWVSDSTGGNGGAGLQNPTGGFFASGSTFQGGAGGNVSYFNTRHAGNGGNGAFVGTNGNGHLLATTCTGGVRGVATFAGTNGQPGLPLTGSGFIEQLSGARRKCTTQPIAAPGTIIPVTIVGQPGDQVFLPWANRGFWQYRPVHNGTWLIPLPVRMITQPIGVIPASGTLTTKIQLAALPPGLDGAVTYFQGYVIDALGNMYLGSPMEVLRR